MSKDNPGVEPLTYGAPDWACNDCNYNRHYCAGCGQEWSSEQAHNKDIQYKHLRDEHPEIMV